MPPRKAKQPAKRKGPAVKKAQPKATATQAVTPSGEEYNPQTHILCDDGRVYERKIVSGTGTAVGVNQTEKSTAHLVLEKKMSDAILQAHNDGVSDPEEIKRRILSAREEHLNNG
jgi:hypothetical protein